MTTYVTVTNASEPCTPGAVITAVPTATISAWNVTFAPSGFTTTANAAGVFSIPLLPTDSSQVNSPGWYWTITVEPTEGVAALVYTFFLSELNGLTQDLSTLSTGNPSAQFATQNYVTSVVAADHYSAPHTAGYAAWNMDPDTTFFIVGSGTTIKAGWPAGTVFLNKIPVPAALSGLTGVLSYSWHAATGTGGLNSFVGIYSLASGVFTRQGVSADVSAQTQSHPNTLTIPYLQNVPADTPTTGLYVGVVIGSQDSVGMGPIVTASGTTSGPTGFRSSSTAFGPVRAYVYNTTGQTALPASIAMSNVTVCAGTTNPAAYSWWAIN